MSKVVAIARQARLRAMRWRPQINAPDPGAKRTLVDANAEGNCDHFRVPGTTTLLGTINPNPTRPKP
jgi:hypothetical protein